MLRNELQLYVVLNANSLASKPSEPIVPVQSELNGDFSDATPEAASRTSSFSAREEVAEIKPAVTRKKIIDRAPISAIKYKAG